MHLAVSQRLELGEVPYIVLPLHALKHEPGVSQLAATIENIRSGAPGEQQVHHLLCAVPEISDHYDIRMGACKPLMYKI